MEWACPTPSRNFLVRIDKTLFRSAAIDRRGQGGPRRRERGMDA
jgi:hypothetical protein